MPRILAGTWRTLLHSRGVDPFDFDPGAVVWSDDMAKRATGVFAAAPICQGNWDGTGVPDNLTFPAGSLVHDYFYANIDAHQGSIVMWVTPEWDGGDGIDHYLIGENRLRLAKLSDGSLYFYVRDGAGSLRNVTRDVSGWTAGTTYLVVCRWDNDAPLDGTNHMSLSVDNAHTYGSSTFTHGVAAAIGTVFIGRRYSATLGASAIIEGLHIFRRVLTDNGGYGVDFGNTPGSDELTDIYNAGNGADPALVTNGSWGITFALPTDAAPGALA